MRRVAITGIGIVSCLGNDGTTVTEALRIGHRARRFMGHAAAYACVALQRAVADACLVFRKPDSSRTRLSIA